jgi:catechol 2,3-dioxygenase-like lactoylglutathione lyase family enzyme
VATVSVRYIVHDVDEAIAFYCQNRLVYGTASGVAGGLDMAIRLGSTVINCADIELMTSFWTRALNLAPSSAEAGDDFRVLRGDRVSLSLQVSRTPVSARDQMHLDLYSDNQAAEVERLAGLGATIVRRHEDPDDDYVVMTDPEGNEFCVCAVAGI